MNNKTKKIIAEAVNIKKNNGFSLIEVATALFVISVGLVGILSLISQNIQAENVNKNKLIASQLAQEGLELVRNRRGDNWLTDNDWNDGITEDNYIVDYTGKIQYVAGIENAVLQMNNEGYYVHDGSYSDTIFKRMIIIESSSTATATASSSVSCHVKWNDRGRNFDYVADTVLYNWR